MTVNLTDSIFHDEEAARLHFEALRWPHGPVCPHCGVIDNATELKGKSTRPGVYKCKDCRKPFTATIGTLYERSHIPLHKWLLATHLLCASKKGISAHQLWRQLGFGSYRTAWFMAHRIREGMREAHLPDPVGGEGKFVEVDETYIGGKEANKHASKRQHRGRGPIGKEPIVSRVERGGTVRSYHVPNVTAATLKPILVSAIHQASHLRTDESGIYWKVGEGFASHQTVNHGIAEYVRGDAHTNTVEGYFAILKRGVYGTYHHVSEAHLKRYIGEFDFRYNYRTKLGFDDATRAALAVKGIAGKRLTYAKPGSGGEARA
ncbi:MAG: IS1595 family transposase [Alphaproteobacteria bacterium]|nr:IS1595 family transposase [Alphaproteobacteria bacterium]